MACKFPLTAYRSNELVNGKRRLVFDKRASFSGSKVLIPCGQCIMCRIDHAAMWATRCMHEKRMHSGSDSAFVTLTYEDKHLPPDGTLVKRDLQLFNKRVRNATGAGVRFYGCGEYGGQFGRPHYHVLFFNRGFREGAKLWKAGKREGDDIYTSPLLSQCWPFGHSVYGDVTYESCRYVAGYVIDKITGDKAPDWYAGREPEFSLMSKGIGLSYYQKYAHEIYAHDSVVVNGAERKPPRYYDDKWKMVDSIGLDEIKAERRRLAARYRFGPDATHARRRVIEEVERLRLLQKKGAPR